MNAQLMCALCDFTVPVDEIGVAVMQQHLASEHEIEPVRDES